MWSVPLASSVLVILALVWARVWGCVTRESVTAGVTRCAKYSSTTGPLVTPHLASIQSATMPLMVSIHVPAVASTTVEPLYTGTPEMRTSPLIRIPLIVPTTQRYVKKKGIPEMRTPQETSSCP